LSAAPLVVLDTMVVVSAVIGVPHGPSASTVAAVATGDVRLAVSDDQLREVVTVMGYEAIENTIYSPVRAFEVALDLGTMGFMYHPRRLDCPSLRDERDGWIFDLAYVSGADYIVSYDRAVRDAADELGFVALPPEELLEALRRQYEP
jgi:putative PIN family toxin of toxin-antitoxin system